MATFKKVDNELEVTKVPEVLEPVITKYSLDFLKKQELDILESMNKFIEQREKELVEVRALIVECEKLGIKTSETLQAEAVIVEETKLDLIK